MSKSIIENYMHTVWNHHDLSIIPEVFDDSAIIHSPLGQFKTPAQMTETVKQWIAAIPNITVELLNTVEGNGLVVSHWKAKGTHQKELNGFKATGKPVEYQGVSMYRFKENKVIEYWAFLDSWTLEKQIKG